MTNAELEKLADIERLLIELKRTNGDQIKLHIMAEILVADGLLANTKHAKDRWINQ